MLIFKNHSLGHQPGPSPNHAPQPAASPHQVQLPARLKEEGSTGQGLTWAWIYQHYILRHDWVRGGNFPVGLVQLKGFKKGDFFVPKKASKKKEKSRPQKIPNQPENYK